jgi:diguanylate cyclase (GGDEF)-like protein
MVDNIDGNNWILNIRSSADVFREYVIKPGKNILGRGQASDCVLNDNAASTTHAEFYYNKPSNTVVLQDLESTNGTFVNGKRIMAKLRQSFQPSTKVTGELILESIEQFGVILHEVGQRLIKMPDIDNALVEISKMIKRMIGAENCEVLLADRFYHLNRMGIPSTHIQNSIDNQSASIFSDIQDESILNTEPVTIPMRSRLLVPVIIDQNVVALIYADKSGQSTNPFTNSDLQLVLAVSNQVAMSIQRSRVESELIHNSNHDVLTDLPNRSFFLHHLSQAISRSKSNGVGFAVLFFDVDDFKVVNDSLGHATGDKFLIAIAERLKHNVRTIDLVARNSVIARFGGDEFAILLDDIDEKSAALVAANRLKDILSRPYDIDGKQIFSTVSIGIAISSIEYESPDEILRNADMAMYQAKDLGKSRVEVYDQEMHQRVNDRMRMSTALRQGALQKELKLHYQPIIQTHSGQIVGFEALMRWHTPDRGILYPGEFFDALDTAGLNYSVDVWALKTACAQLVEWEKEYSNTELLYMSVNLSANNIKHPNLVENIEEILMDTGLNPNRLWLEITEEVSAPNDEQTIEVLRKLRALGLRISLDDFGTGYSALNYLAKFPVDVIKIDRSFIEMIGTNDDSLRVIEMIVALANHLKLIVVAEGIEKKGQVDFLQSINCEYAQGFLFSKPMEADNALNFFIGSLSDILE